MSKASELIATALSANQKQATSLGQLAVDQATLDAATSTQTQHSDDAKSQADSDAKAVTVASKAIGTDLDAVATAQQEQDAAITALGELKPTAPV